jgi:3-oxoadipate enol-lactonase
MSPETERRELVRPDATIAYWLSGSPQAPTVLLLHGATVDHHAWEPQVAALATRCRVVAPDLRGHGESTLAGTFRFEDVIADVFALLDEVRTDAPLALVGLSLGGNIVQEIVYRAPDLVDALVVADATCNTAPRHPLAASITIAALSTMALTGRDRFMQRAAAVTSVRADVRRYLLGANTDRSPRDVVRILASLVDDALHPDPHYRLPVPTLLLHGAQDRVGDIVASSRKWAARDPAVEYVALPDAGHASNQDNPEAFTAAVTAFLDRELVVPAAEVPQAPDEPLGLARRIGRRLRSTLARRAS